MRSAVTASDYYLMWLTIIGCLSLVVATTCTVVERLPMSRLGKCL